ncbi:lipid II:glycine glycyltransferase FemX [Rhodovulum sp. PH10]|uniref:lipid II:glycine glycyltransferase FemX n=1 Tax=Rhodovulum sp. PH10 TaxID=1187851 RepID=UPI0012FCC4BA|nr:GNAT family N-acetyltransferase [Rhodovulum sp. PH10]
MTAAISDFLASGDTDERPARGSVATSDAATSAALPGGWVVVPARAAARAGWNAALEALPDGSPFQSDEWGAYRENLGGRSLRYAVPAAGGGFRAMCLLQLRRFPDRTGIACCIGGPVGDVSAWSDLPAAILRSQNLSRLYVRFRCDRPREAADVVFLRRHGWQPPAVDTGLCLSLALDLSTGPEALLAGLDRRWRRNLRHAQEAGLTVARVKNPDAGEVRALFAEMEGRKHLPSLFSQARLAALFRHAGPRLSFLECRDGAGRLVAVRGAATVGDRACDYLAASSPEGRRLCASYLLLWEQLARCRRAGVVHYDLGGIDPWKNPGGHQFKRQTGAREVEYLGEWDFATSPALRATANWLIGKRHWLPHLPHLPHLPRLGSPLGSSRG